MIELNVKEARARISEVLDWVEAGEEVILVRRGRRIARIIPERELQEIPLPSLQAFRSRIEIRGAPMSALVAREREER